MPCELNSGMVRRQVVVVAARVLPGTVITRRHLSPQEKENELVDLGRQKGTVLHIVAAMKSA